MQELNSKFSEFTIDELRLLKEKFLQSVDQRISQSEVVKKNV